MGSEMCIRDRPYKVLYRVNFKQLELWPDYDGAADDTLEIEIYEHWMAPV